MPQGHTGKMLWVDLTAGRWRIEAQDPDPNFFGGRGLNQRRLFELQPEGKDGLDPQSPILLSAGPLVGTLVPGACRLAVDFRNLVTGGVGSANLGGHFAAEMKFAGFDQIVIQGRSPRPVYLLVTPETVVLRDAAGLWGVDTWETENRIKRLENDPRIKTLSIGPAGENGVRFACLIGDRGRAAGYGGCGAVFGAKRLKAIAVRGGLPVTAAHPEALLDEVVRFNREVIEKSDFVKVHRGGGTLAAYLLPGENRPHAVGNMTALPGATPRLLCLPGLLQQRVPGGRPGLRGAPGQFLAGLRLQPGHHRPGDGDAAARPGQPIWPGRGPRLGGDGLGGGMLSARDN